MNSVLIIGCNDRVELLHKDAKTAILFLHAQGKPRNESIFETMKETIIEFKQGLKVCKKNEL